jgi:hypothetical protein
VKSTATIPLGRLCCIREAYDETYSDAARGGLVAIYESPAQNRRFRFVLEQQRTLASTSARVKRPVGKRPFAWTYRPSAGPVWNHHNRRLARFWSADRGTHTGVLELIG